MYGKPVHIIQNKLEEERVKHTKMSKTNNIDIQIQQYECCIMDVVLLTAYESICYVYSFYIT